jgi:hypothetical protein
MMTRNDSTVSPASISRRLTVVPAAGYAYLAVWIVGICVWPSDLALDASSSSIAAAYRGHAGRAIVQYALVEGAAGLLFGFALAMSVAALGRRAGRRPGRVGALIGAVCVATAVSLAQCGLGLAIVSVAGDGDNPAAATLFHTVNVLDGVKMLLLAAVATSFAVGVAAVVPAWLRWLAGLAAIALAASGLTYVVQGASLAWLVYLSGPLLLAWVAGVGTWSARVTSDYTDDRTQVH